MGIRGLQSFMEYHVTDGACQVNIKDIIHTYKRETGNERVVIVVDACSCLRPLYGSLDWVCGGQIKEYVDKFKTFIKAFTNIGVELVFFFDGPTQGWKRKLWCDRRLRSLNDVQEVFRLLANDIGPSQIPHNLLQLPASPTLLACYAVQTSPGCKLRRTIRECDEEMVEYAVENRCFALLGQDSDYIIYNGPQYYLSVVHLNLQTMTTVNYNRWALARYLHIDADMLPLFASLVGNDLIPSDDLRDFHQRLMRNMGRYGRPNVKDVMFAVAGFIRSNANKGNIYSILPSISKEVFGNETRASLLHLSIRSYSLHRKSASDRECDQLQPMATDPTEKWKRLQKIAEERFVNGELDSMIYAVMHSLPYESSTILEDFSKTEMPPSTLAFCYMRQRIYGIALFEKPREEGEEVFVEEWCVSGPDSLRVPDRVPAIFPQPDCHPGLLALWNNKADQSEDVQSKRWRLLATAVSPKLNPEKLKSLPPTLVVPTILLFRLFREMVPSFLELWEVEAFIATAVILPLHDLTTLSHVMVQRVNPRAVQLASIYLRGSSVVHMLMSLIGYPIPRDMVSPWNFFDGKLFHTMYLKAKSGQDIMDLHKHQVVQMEEFNLVRSIVLSEDL